MSSLPGFSLEDYVSWNWDLIVQNQAESNVSLGIAEMMGVKTNRKYCTAEQFKVILELYEPYREDVEYKLLNFDEENQSWRNYADCVFDAIPNNIHEQAEQLIKQISVEGT